MLRIWFPLAPNGSIGANQRTQEAIGYSGITVGPPPLPPEPPPIVYAPFYTDYFRRYLQDTLVVQTSGPPINQPTIPETADTTYMRRYLQDIIR